MGEGGGGHVPPLKSAPVLCTQVIVKSEQVKDNSVLTETSPKRSGRKVSIIISNFTPLKTQLCSACRPLP